MLIWSNQRWAEGAVNEIYSQSYWVWHSKRRWKCSIIFIATFFQAWSKLFFLLFIKNIYIYFKTFFRRCLKHRLQFYMMINSWSSTQKIIAYKMNNKNLDFVQEQSLIYDKVFTWWILYTARINIKKNQICHSSWQGLPM